MKIKQILAKSCILAIVSFMGVSTGAEVAHAYDYGYSKTVVCNGGDYRMHSTDGGRYFQYAWQSNTEFGLKSKIREHKISQQPQGTNYWAYERGISFPEPLEIGTDFELKIDAYGYAYGSKMSAYNDLTQAQMNAKVNVNAEVTLANGRVIPGDVGIMGGYNDGKQPIYKEHYGYVYNTYNMPSWANGQKIKAFYLKVVNAPTIPSSGDNRYRYLYLIDSLTITVKSLTTPENRFIYRANGDTASNVYVDSMTGKQVNSIWVRPKDSVQDSGVTKPTNIWMYTYQALGNSSINRIIKNYMKFVTTYNPKGTKVIDERYVIDENKGYSHYNHTDSTSIINDGKHNFYRTNDTEYYEYCSYYRIGFDWDNVDYDVFLAADSANGNVTYYTKKAVLKTDGRAPSVNLTPEITDGNVNTATILFHGAGDVRGDGDKVRPGVGMSTVEDIDQSLKIYKPGEEQNAVYVYVTQRTETYVDENGVQRYDLKWVINYDDAKFNSLDLKSYYGELKFKIHLEDLVGNAFESGEYTINRADPAPEGAKVSLNSWHYSAPNDNVKWVNTKDKFQVQTWIWSNPQFSTLPAGYPTETEFMLPDKYADVATVSKNTQSNVTGFGLSSTGLAVKYEETDKAGVTRKGITSQRDLIAKSTAIGKIYTPTSTGATDWMGTKYPLGEEVTEIHGYKVAVDDTKPAGTSVKVGRTESQISVKDSESGLKKVTLVADGETLLDKTYRDLDTINPSQKKVTSDTIIVDTKQHDTGKLTVVDNVGNTTVVNLKDLLTKTTSQIEINDVPIISPPGGSFPNGVDQGIKGWASLNPQGVEKDGRRYLKVEATGGVTKNPVPGFTPIFRLRGSGPEITFSSADIMATGSPKLSVADATKNPIYIDDNYNTPNAPALKYTTNSTEAKIYWDAMEDPLRDYNFIVDSKVSNRENFIKELETTGGVKFASGYDHYTLKVYRVSGNGVKPTAGQKPIIDKETKELEFNLNMWESGWLYVECTMYDFNGNPSGTARVWFNHDQPTLYTDISVTVTAIKDIDWEKATYPFEYGYGIDAPGEVVEHTHGKDYDKFPLGKNYKFNNKPIAQGYAINYNIIKESREELSDLTIRYKYYGDNGELLTMKSKGELLSTIDNKEGTNYTKQVLSSSELARLNKSTVDRIPVYLKHFAPVDVEAYKPNGELYTGNVTVKVEFVSHVDGKEFTRGLRLYTFTTSETALDNLEGDKQR